MNARNFLIAATVVVLGALPRMIAAQTDSAAPGPPPAAPPPNPAVTAKARAEYLAWRAGNVLRSRYDDNMKPHITSELIAQVHAGLTQAGPPGAFKLERARTVQSRSNSTSIIEIHVYDFVITATHGSGGMELGVAPNGLIDGIYFQPLAPVGSGQPAS